MARGAPRTLSARILAGFALLILAFSATMVWIVLYVNDLRLETEVIRTRYLRVTIAAKDLAGQQQELYDYLKEDLPAETKPQVVRRVTEMRRKRAAVLASLTRTLDGLQGTSRKHWSVGIHYVGRLRRVQQDIEAEAPRYAELLAEPPITPSLQRIGDFDPKRLHAAVNARTALLGAEQGLASRLNALATSLRDHTEAIAKNLERNAQRLRTFNKIIGVIAVLVGLLVTAWVTFSLRPLVRLRTAARRIAAGDYASRVDETGPDEVAGLAREFNAMGRAVEERERELVRSERLAAVGKMAAMITHEVRNPLSSIALNSELLEEELAALDAGDEAKELCRAIGREVDRLTAITEEYLTFARLPKPRLAPGSLPALVDDLARFVRDDLASRGVTLEVEHARDLPPAMLDEGQIRQSVLNLVRNAAEAVATRGGGHVWIRTHAAGDAVAVAVADDGPGIPAELRERLFDPFVSTKDGGTGLGLALTHQIVRDHGGDITVESQVDRGSTFTIVLPAA